MDISRFEPLGLLIIISPYCMKEQ